MFQFDLTKEPLTNRELEAERQTLKSLRKKQIKYSCISDVLHAFIFICLYFNQTLSGYAILLTVALSTIVALPLAMGQSNYTSKIIVFTLSLGTTLSTILVLLAMMKQPLAGSIIAGLTAGSIIIVGGTLGKTIKKVLATIEALKPIGDDTIARQEVMELCRKYPELETYRESASMNLRPHLTYGELSSMRKWKEKNHQHKEDSI